MPFLRVETNVDVSREQAGAILEKLSAAVAPPSGKPESAFQLILEGGKPMLMAQSDAPSAHVDYKAIGPLQDKAGALSAAICDVLAETLAIDGKRVYITFSDFERSMWGKNGGTL